MTILCPICKTNEAPAPKWSFADTSVEVETCGGHGPILSVTVKTSALLGLEVPASRLRHSEGLAVFS